MSSATGMVLRTTWRGARGGLAGVAFIGLVIGAVGWMLAWSAWQGRGAELQMALNVSLFGGFFALLASALLTAVWLQMRKPPMVRLSPLGASAQRRAMAWTAAGQWLLVGAPTLAATLAEAWRPGSQLGWAPALAWSLGIPLAAAAAGAAFMVLPSRPWMRWLAAAVLWLPFGLSLPEKLVALPPALRDAVLGACGLAGLLLAAWAFTRVAQSLSQTPTAPLAEGQTVFWNYGATSQDFKGPTPLDTRWLATPHLRRSRPQDMLVAVVMALALVVVLPRWTGLPTSFSLQLTLIVAGTSVPWFTGAWASPRWSLLPGGLARRHAVWQVWWHSLHGGWPPVATAVLSFVLAGLVFTDLGWVNWLATVMISLGMVLLGSGLAVAALSRFQSKLVLAAGSVVALFAGCGLQLWVIPQWSGPATTDDAQIILRALGVLAGLGALGLLALVLSARAWARFDWASMAKVPPAHAALMRAMRRG